MAARLLFGRPAGMKDSGAFFRRNARQLQFLEHRGRHSGNLRPMVDRFRRQSAHLADFAVGEIVLELESEQIQSQIGKLPTADCRLPVENQFAQARGEAG